VAKSAVTELTDHVESIRQEAYNEGYAAAMRAVLEFSTFKTVKPKATVANPAAKTTSAEPTPRQRQERAQVKTAGRQTRRGENVQRIAEAMMTLPDHTGRAAAIKKVLVEKGHNIAFTSIRHGLGQLQARGEASVADDGRTWSYTAAQHLR
jgi:hypothetical protein